MFGNSCVVDEGSCDSVEDHVDEDKPIPCARDQSQHYSGLRDPGEEVDMGGHQVSMSPPRDCTMTEAKFLVVGVPEHVDLEVESWGQECVTEGNQEGQKVKRMIQGKVIDQSCASVIIEDVLLSNTVPVVHVSFFVAVNVEGQGESEDTKRPKEHPNEKSSSIWTKNEVRHDNKDPSDGGNYEADHFVGEVGKDSKRGSFSTKCPGCKIL